MNQPFIFSLMEYLEQNVGSLPKPSLEWLEPEGYSVAIVQNDAPKVVKSYINGTTQHRINLELLLQTNTTQRIKALEDMESYLSIFYGMNGKRIGEHFDILRVEATTPSLRAQTENLMLRYGFSVTIVYGG